MSYEETADIKDTIVIYLMYHVDSNDIILLNTQSSVVQKPSKNVGYTTVVEQSYYIRWKL